MISFDKAKRIIDSSKSAYPELSMLVLTGGECFTIGKDLDHIISYAHKAGFGVRIVTNASWATSFKKAYKKIESLITLGLTELNISCGDEHQQWIKFDNVIYATVACILLKITLAINVESSSLKEISTDNINNDYRLKKFGNLLSHHVYITKGKWMYFRRQNKEKLKILLDDNLKTRKQLRCTNILTTINVFYNMNMYSCCGLTNIYNKYLFIGNCNNNSIDKIYEKQFNDFLKIWLFTEGPGAIYNFIMRKRKMPQIDDSSWHICQICQEIFMDNENIKTLKLFYREKFASVILKYKFYREKNLNFKNK